VDEATLAYLPIGETDSELAFCTLLSRLEPHYRNHEAPSLETRLDVFSGLCEEMKKLGASDFLYDKSVTRIGDCLAPGAIVHATYAGHRYALELDTAPSELVLRHEFPEL